jgi:hypothetical protein
MTAIGNVARSDVLHDDDSVCYAFAWVYIEMNSRHIDDF